MSRFLGLVLMVATGMVAVDLIGAAGFDSGELLAIAIPSFLILGLLLGFLATGRYLAWAAFAAVMLAIPQLFTEAYRFPWQKERVSALLALLLVPPFAVLTGGILGGRWLKWRWERRARPSADE